MQRECHVREFSRNEQAFPPTYPSHCKSALSFIFLNILSICNLLSFSDILWDVNDRKWWIFLLIFGNMKAYMTKISWQFVQVLSPYSKYSLSFFLSLIEVYPSCGAAVAVQLCWIDSVIGTGVVKIKILISCGSCLVYVTFRLINLFSILPKFLWPNIANNQIFFLPSKIVSRNIECETLFILAVVSFRL